MNSSLQIKLLNRSGHHGKCIHLISPLSPVTELTIKENEAVSISMILRSTGRL